MTRLHFLHKQIINKSVQLVWLTLPREVGEFNACLRTSFISMIWAICMWDFHWQTLTKFQLLRSHRWEENLMRDSLLSPENLDLMLQFSSNVVIISQLTVMYNKARLYTKLVWKSSGIYQIFANVFIHPYMYSTVTVFKRNISSSSSGLMFIITAFEAFWNFDSCPMPRQWLTSLYKEKKINK